MDKPWSHPISLRQVRSVALSLELAPGAIQLKSIGRFLRLAGLESLKARLTVAPWLDGLTVKGTLAAELIYVCGVTLEPFPAHIEEDFELKFVPQSSPLAAPPQTEVSIDLDAEDPPEILDDGDVVDLGTLVVEQLSLALDPFPRKPGAVFEPPAENTEISPFAVLKSLKREP